MGTFNRRRALDRLLEAASGGSVRSADPGWPDPPVAIDAAVREHLEASLAELEALLPPDPGVVRYLGELDPDAVLVTPVIRPGLHQTEVVKAARLLGIRSGFPVYSWDSLSNKGRLHAVPDRLYAWNDVHRREAIELHGVDEEQVVVIGAPHWDGFFELEPSEDRQALCSRYGLDPARPIVLYLGSTRTVCHDEPEVVEGWLDTLRTGPASLREANVLVRPHPGDADEPRWADWSPPGPRAARSTRSGKADQTLFDELFHADAVVGLNTSAQIEASILGKPVYTFSAGAAAAGQEGSLHFYYLLEDQGGVVRYADSPSRARPISWSAASRARSTARRSGRSASGSCVHAASRTRSFHSSRTRSRRSPTRRPGPRPHRANVASDRPTVAARRPAQVRHELAPEPSVRRKGRRRLQDLRQRERREAGARPSSRPRLRPTARP